MRIGLNKFFSVVLILCWAVVLEFGCRSALEYRVEADEVAGEIIENKMAAMGRREEFEIERSSDILRRRLLTEQQLAYCGTSSLGTDQLEVIEHWPEEDYPKSGTLPDPIVMVEGPDEAVRLSLVEALQVGARNSFEYQSHKEDIFSAALELDLERNEFRNIFSGQVDSLIETDMGGNRTVSGMEYSGGLGVTRQLESGVALSTELAVSLANLLTLNRASAFGISGDGTVSIPLLRGSGRHIVTEPLTQAERNVVYSIYDFESFRRSFSVSVAAEYLIVLRQLDVVENSEENYRGLIRSARRARRLADAGRLPEVQVDQAVQNELRARDRWINATETYKSRLDSFKNLLGLPPDAKIGLEGSELERLASYSRQFSKNASSEGESGADVESLPAGASVELEPPDTENVGPLEIDESKALELAFENRYDLMVAEGEVYDAQRAVVVLGDALGAELTLLGSAELGGDRTTGAAGQDDTNLRADKGEYSGLVTLDLPFERTAERNAYRNGFIALERAVREVQKLEDEIKISIRNKLRDLLESRESLMIQARSVKLARKRVRSTNMFLEAGRAQIRDLLEAQEALLSAQNSLTSATINYRIAELELQRDMGVLRINEKGLWQEYSPGES